MSSLDTLLHLERSEHARPVLYRDAIKTLNVPQNTHDNEALVKRFHESLPGFKPTPLVSLPELARRLGVKGVYVKDESTRLGLPAFKILGASWAVFRAVTDRLGLPLDTKLEDIKTHPKVHGVHIYAASAGNHGRACAWISRILGAKCTIFVPRLLDNYTKEKISSEGAEVSVVQGDYDEAVRVAFNTGSSDPHGTVVQDTAFDGYEEIPSWIVSGYSSMLREVDEQINADIVITPIGVGSLGQAVATHWKSQTPFDNPKHPRRVITVEPDTAACLYTSFQGDSLVTIDTSYTIMDGMNCGTPSSIGWPILRQTVDAAATVSDHEAHIALEYLKTAGLNAGPCGGAALAALAKIAADASHATLTENSVVVLLSTEGARPYPLPKDVSKDDAISVTQSLVRIDSSNPTLSEGGGAGETEIADWIAAWLSHRGIENHKLEKHAGRPSIIGRVKGSGGGKSLMLNGHIDTVSLQQYEGDGLSGLISEIDGKTVIEGRGSQDMKAGVAVAMTALLAAKELGNKLKGDVILAAVADEEDASMGTEEILEAGWTADAGVVLEPTDEMIGDAHKGFVWIQVETLGVAAHGSRPAEGVDAIANMAEFILELQRYNVNLPTHEYIGKASCHCGIIKGGTETSSYPGSCSLTVEIRTVPPQTPEGVRQDIEDILEDLNKRSSTFQYRKPTIPLQRPVFQLERSNAFSKFADKHLASGAESYTALSFWCDAALMYEKGIPSVVYGPKGSGLHSKREWIEVESIKEVERRVISLMTDYCC